jgi:hypothetical protein
VFKNDLCSRKNAGVSACIARCHINGLKGGTTCCWRRSAQPSQFVPGTNRFGRRRGAAIATARIPIAEDAEVEPIVMHKLARLKIFKAFSSICTLASTDDNANAARAAPRSLDDVAPCIAVRKHPRKVDMIAHCRSPDLVRASTSIFRTRRQINGQPAD